MWMEAGWRLDDCRGLILFLASAAARDVVVVVVVSPDLRYAR